MAENALDGRIGAHDMFTTKSTNNYQLDGEAYVNGRWESLSLEEMYQHGGIWTSISTRTLSLKQVRMRTLAASTCHRDARD